MKGHEKSENGKAIIHGSKKINVVKKERISSQVEQILLLTLLHSERPKLYTVLAFLSAKALKETPNVLASLLFTYRRFFCFIFSENFQAVWIFAPHSYLPSFTILA